MDVEIAHIRDETPQIKAFELQSPDGQDLPAFRAGAHIDVDVVGNRKNKRIFWANEKVPKEQRGFNHANHRSRNEPFSACEKGLTGPGAKDVAKDCDTANWSNTLMAATGARVIRNIQVFQCGRINGRDSLPFNVFRIPKANRRLDRSGRIRYNTLPGPTLAEGLKPCCRLYEPVHETGARPS